MFVCVWVHILGFILLWVFFVYVYVYSWACTFVCVFRWSAVLASVFAEKPVRRQSLVLLAPGEQTSFNNIYLSNCFTLQLFAKTKYQNPSEIHNSFLYHASLRTGRSDLIHGRKIQMDLISWPRGCFFPSLFTHIAYFHSRFMGIIILSSDWDIVRLKTNRSTTNRIIYLWLVTFLYFHTLTSIESFHHPENLFCINFPPNLQGSRLAEAQNIRSDFWPMSCLRCRDPLSPRDFLPKPL